MLVYLCKGEAVGQDMHCGMGWSFFNNPLAINHCCIFLLCQKMGALGQSSTEHVASRVHFSISESLLSHPAAVISSQV